MIEGKLKIVENGVTSLYIKDSNGYVAEGNNKEKVEEIVNKFNNSIQLRNIDLSGISKLEQFRKVKEELKELFDALVEDEYYEAINGDKTELKDHIIEEFLDVVQAFLGLIEKHDIPAEKVMQHYPLHEEKIKHRPRHKEE